MGYVGYVRIRMGFWALVEGEYGLCGLCQKSQPMNKIIQLIKKNKLLLYFIQYIFYIKRVFSTKSTVQRIFFFTENVENDVKQKENRIPVSIENG